MYINPSGVPTQTARGKGYAVLPVPTVLFPRGRGFGAVKNYGKGKMLVPGLGGLGQTCNTPCCGPIGRHMNDGTVITAAMCAGQTICNDSCNQTIANPYCVPGNPGASDSVCSTENFTGSPTPGVPNTVYGYNAGTNPPPWNPAVTYQYGDLVVDSCGQVWECQFPNPTWSFVTVMVGAGQIGTTGCVGPNGTTSMNPNWLNAALAAQPGGPPPSGTPAGQAQLAASAAAPATAAGATPAGSNPVSAALSSTVQIGGASIPAWLIAAAAGAGLLLMVA